MLREGHLVRVVRAARVRARLRVRVRVRARVRVRLRVRVRCARVTSSLAPAIGMFAAAAHSRSGRRETAARSSAPRRARRAAALSPG